MNTLTETGIDAAQNCLTPSEAHPARVRVHDLTGQRFGRLTAQIHCGKSGWLCVCDCGQVRRRTSFALRNGAAVSCGCAQKDAKAERAALLAHRLDAKLAREILDYDPHTGVFVWKKRLAQRVKIGDVAGRSMGRYRALHIGGRDYAAHRVAWLYVYGVWPPEQVDHINLDGHDNRISNLRLATPGQNQQNKRVGKNNRSGYKGVCQYQGRWRAEIMAQGKKMALGCFDSAEEASAAYVAAKRRLHSHFVEGQGVRRA